MVERVKTIFGELLPDHQDRDNPGLVKAENVLPHFSSYTPARDLRKVADALDSYCLGAQSLIDVNGTSHNYAGSLTKLYELVNSNYNDISRVGDYSLDELDRWEFIRAPSATLENHAIAANGEDPLQVQLDFTGNFQDITNVGVDPVPALKHITALRGFIFGGNVPGNNALLKWSALNQYNHWDIGDNSAGEQTLPRGGAITRVLGGEYGIVFCENSIFRINYLGDSQIVFEINEVSPRHGTRAPGSVVQYGKEIYFIDSEGFYVFNGATAIPIGSNKLNHEFVEDYDNSFAHKVVSAIDIESDLVYWAYPGRGNRNGLPNKIMVFDRTTGKFAGPLKLEVEELLYGSVNTIALLDDVNTTNYPQWPELAGSPGETDLDQVPVNLDDPIFKGGGDEFLAAFNANHELSSFLGDVLPALIETGEIALNEHGRSFVNGVRALVDGSNPNIRIRVGTRNDTYGNIRWSAQQVPHPRTELAPFRADARYHRIELEVNGEFEHIFGAEADFERSGYA